MKPGCPDSSRVQCYDFTVDHRVVGKIGQTFEHKWVLSVERIPAPGKEIQLAGRFHTDGAVAVQFDFVSHCAPSGSFANARHSIGSINVASRRGRDFKPGMGRPCHTTSAIGPHRS